MGSLAAPRRGGKELWGLRDGAEPPAQPGGGCCRAGPGDQRLRILRREPQRDRHLPATRQKPSLASKGEKAPLMRLLKTRALEQQGGKAQARQRGW